MGSMQARRPVLRHPLLDLVVEEPGLTGHDALEDEDLVVLFAQSTLSKLADRSILSC